MQSFDFTLDALPNDCVSYFFHLIRYAKDCGEPIPKYPGPTLGPLDPEINWQEIVESLRNALCDQFRN